MVESGLYAAAYVISLFLIQSTILFQTWKIVCSILCLNTISEPMDSVCYISEITQ